MKKFQIPALAKPMIRNFFSRESAIQHAEEIKPFIVPIAIEKLQGLSQKYEGQYDSATEKVSFMLSARGESIIAIPYVVGIDNEKPLRRFQPVNLNELLSQTNTTEMVGKFYDQLLK